MDLASTLTVSTALFMAVLAFALGLVFMAVVAKIRLNTIQAQWQLSSQQQQQALEREFQQQLMGLRDQNTAHETRADSNQQQVLQLTEQYREKEQQLMVLQQRYAEQSAQFAALNAELEQHRKAADEKIALLQQAREQLSSEFTLLSNRIFDEKSDRFTANSKSTLENVLNPLREQLREFKQKVEDVYDKDSKERLTLVTELEHLKQLNQQMSVDAVNLTRALKGDNKVQGNWGEVVLERVLEESGLHKGREYDTQVSLTSANGQRRSPDVVVRLPENKDIIIDSKVSLLHFEHYCNSSDESQRQRALSEHINSVRSHINGLSVKDYEGLEGIRSLDFVFIFIPIESAFMAAFDNDQAMFREAYEKNIIVVGPTTLLASLRTVQSIWRYERQNKNAEEIARQAGAMHDKFVGFIADLDKIAAYLNKASQAREDAMAKLATGKGNLVSSTQRLEKLGAKVKKSLPAVALDDSVPAVERLDPVSTESPNNH